MIMNLVAVNARFNISQTIEWYLCYLSYCTYCILYNSSCSSYIWVNDFDASYNIHRIWLLERLTILLTRYDEVGAYIRQIDKHIRIDNLF